MENWMEELLDGIIEKKFEQNRRVSNCHQTIDIVFYFFSIVRYDKTTVILNFQNTSVFAHETADIKLAYVQSTVSLDDGFEKKSKYEMTSLKNYLILFIFTNGYKCKNIYFFSILAFCFACQYKNLFSR